MSYFPDGLGASVLEGISPDTTSNAEISSTSDASEKTAVPPAQSRVTTPGSEFNEKKEKEKKDNDNDKNKEKPTPDYKSEEVGADLGPDDAAIQDLPWHVRRR